MLSCLLNTIINVSEVCSNICRKSYTVAASTSTQLTEENSIHMFPSFSYESNLCHQMRVLLSEASPQCHHREPPNQYSVPFRRWYREQEAIMWSVICSSALQLQFAEGTPSPLCALLSSPTTVRGRFNLIQEALARDIPGGEGPGEVIRRRSLLP